MDLFTALISFLIAEILLFFIYSITVKSPEFESMPETKRNKNKEKLFKFSINFTLLVSLALTVAVLIT